MHNVFKQFENHNVLPFQNDVIPLVQTKLPPSVLRLRPNQYSLVRRYVLSCCLILLPSDASCSIARKPLRCVQYCAASLHLSASSLTNSQQVIGSLVN